MQLPYCLRWDWIRQTWASGRIERGKALPEGDSIIVLRERRRGSRAGASVS